MRKFLTKYDHHRPLSPHGGVSLTTQQFRDECDISSIIKKYNMGQNLPQNPPPKFGDFSDIGDFASVLNRINAARDSFAALPAEVRARFGNDERQFLEFCTDPSNVNDLVDMGLASRRSESEIDVLRDIRDRVTAPAVVNSSES